MDTPKSIDAMWPCQRIRLAFGALLFFIFEVTIGKQLPMLMTYLILGLGMTCAVSAFFALRSFKLQYQLDRIKSAFQERSAITSTTP